MSNVNFKPNEDRVLIEPAAAEEKTASGIIIPDTAKEKPQKGIVIAVGPGTEDTKITVKVGETVLYGKYAGTELSFDGKDYLIMKNADIFGTIG
ncbi:MAG: chaperonin GroES [Marivirga sp.]|jgi:chaperonin GroES